MSAGEPDADGVPLLADRPLRDGAATAYVCRSFVCQAPVTAPEALAPQVGARAGAVSLQRTASVPPGDMGVSE